MKLRITLTLAALVLLFALTACSTDITEDLGPQAKLLSLTVTTADLRTIEVSVIPMPIPSEDWDDEEYEVVGADFGVIYAKRDDDMENGVRLNPKVSAGARVQWGKARAGNKPDSFTDPRVGDSFTYDDFLYFKVTADDGITTNYYRFYSRLASPVKELVEFYISGREAQKVPEPAESMATLTASVKGGQSDFYGRTDITEGEATRAVINPVPAQADATFRYAVAQTILTADQPGEWQKNITNFADGNILYVEVTAQNEEDQYFYAFQVMTGRIATIATLKLSNVEVVGKGTPARQWAAIGAGSFASADQPSGGFGVQIVPTDAGAVYDYAVVAANVTVPSPFNDWNPEGGWRRSGAARIENSGQQLVVRVRPARAKDADTGDMRFYRIPVTLLAANFKTQPKSTAYTVTNDYTTTLTPTQVDFNFNGDMTEQRILITDTGAITLDRAITPLSFELDRGGSFTYQWYESNSWYGGYGFDRDGRIYGDPGYGEGLSTADRDTIGSGLAWDEKQNVSLHNGGNQYYRLEAEGRPILGATQATYTPTITAKNRPFNTGFSNSTHYYWVVATSGSNKATSARAAIVVEWRRPWNHGIWTPDGDWEAKKHYIVDLHAFTDNPKRTAEGLQGLPKNPTPFIDGNHRDKYEIPIKFPTNFDIMDYTVVTCQALFYLADGRQWIQNWTQGDFGFAKSGEIQVLWYNLTNDNATRGLDKSGNDPQGSSLNEIPTHVVIQPAGTSSVKIMPPFTPQGLPDKAAIEAQGKTAQGWFTPYIEIVELRFEGPARTPAP